MKETDRFADSLLTWIKDLLHLLGVSKDVTNRLDEVIFLILILIIAFAVGKLVHLITLTFTRKILKYHNIKILSSMIELNALRKLSWIIPPLIVLSLLPFAFEGKPGKLDIAERITWIYFTFVFTISVNVVLSSVERVILTKGELQNRPMKGFIQILQVLFSFIAGIIVISILLNKSPSYLITGLGAFAAVLMLVFRDTILGFVAGVLLSQNDMIHIGDWIEMDSAGVNGTVTDITLNIVKVQNFDNTVVTIPPYSLVSSSFINWRGMSESGGRRIMRSYTIATDNIQACTPEYLEDMKKIDLISSYITEKQKEQSEGKVANTENTNGLVNGTIETNLGLFRAYMTIYLKQHRFINNDLTLMVRTLEPTPNGLPLQIYCFSANKNWVSYESIQAEIMEHFAVMLPKFGLYPFQNASARDYINSGILEAGVKPEDLYGLPWHIMRKETANTVENAPKTSGKS